MDSISLDKRTKIFFSVNDKMIGRIPTKSNLKRNGSDNSLYLGMSNNELIQALIKKIFSYSDIEEFNNKNFEMRSYGHLFEVITNINNEGQLQLKIGGNGTMHSIFVSYQMFKEKNINLDEIIILVDFKNNVVEIKEISEVAI